MHPLDYASIAMYRLGSVTDSDKGSSRGPSAVEVSRERAGRGRRAVIQAHARMLR